MADGNAPPYERDRGAAASAKISLDELAAGMKPSYEQVRAITTFVRESGRLPDWFGPGTPLAPTGPAILAGRRFDYNTGINTTSSTPKVGEGIDFATLRSVSRAYDMVRMAIQTRKDQIAKLAWGFVPKDKTKKADQRCADMQKFFASPDKENTWGVWLGMLLEDLLVLDAPTIYPRLANDGTLYALELIDGATVKRIVDDYGRTPGFDDAGNPLAAYQQRIKGMSAFNYTREQLMYRPKNLTTDRLYGYSPVEQIIVTVNLALRRQAYQLQYYTEGSTPDLILSVPPEWTPGQVAEFQQYWDSILSGQTGKRRGTMFVFNGTQAINTKEAVLTDKFDEWLTRIVMFCFGMSPAPFVAQMNRATAESAYEQAKEEGVAPYMQWLKDIIDYILCTYCDAEDLQFVWQEEEEVDPETKTKIEDMRVRNGTLSINEVRERNGEDPIDGGDTHLIFTAGGATPLDQVLEPPPPPEPILGAANIGKPGAKPEAVPPDTSAAKLVKAAPPTTRQLTTALAKVLRRLSKTIAHDVGPHLGAARKGRKTTPEAQAIIDGLDLSVLGDAKGVYAHAATSAMTKGGNKGLFQVGVQKNDPAFDIIPTSAVTYANARAAELLGSDASGGLLGDSTRLMIRTTISQALEEGWSLDDLSTVLEEDYAFSAARAEVIAETEISAAINQGELEAWKVSGVVEGKEWLLSNDEGVCDICEPNAEQGVIPIDEDFDSGDDAPPAHPNCRCSMAPVVSADEED